MVTAAPGVTPDGLEVAVWIGTDPHGGPGGRYCQPLDPSEHGGVPDRRSGGTNVPDAPTPPLAPNARSLVGHVSELRELGRPPAVQHGRRYRQGAHRGTLAPAASWSAISVLMVPTVASKRHACWPVRSSASTPRATWSGTSLRRKLYSVIGDDGRALLAMFFPCPVSSPISDDGPSLAPTGDSTERTTTTTQRTGEPRSPEQEP